MEERLLKKYGKLENILSGLLVSVVVTSDTLHDYYYG
jgi:hypothetical protein